MEKGHFGGLSLSQRSFVASEVEEYLRGKGLAVKPGANGQIHLACWECGEEANKRGRLYVDTRSENAPFNCFLCGYKGNIYTMKRHFGDVVDEPVQINDRKQHALERAAEFFVDSLTEEAYTYLREERGFDAETIDEFQFGFDNGGLGEFLRAEGFTAEEINSTGLVTQRGDFLAGNITIPYKEFGRVVQIRGKKIGGKYLTPPGNPTRIFNLDAAMDAEEVFICEGEADATTLSQWGYAALGVPGANVWQEHWDGALHAAKRIYICFDNDDPGRSGAEKLATRFAARARIVQLPEANDINEWFMSGKGRDDFEFLVRRSRGGLLLTVNDAYEEWLEVDGNPDLVGVKTGFGVIDAAITPGITPGQVAVFLSKTNTGKGHPLDTDVLTTRGWIKWGELVVGDFVYGSDGKPTEVTAIYDRGVLPTYKVTFSDKSSVEVDGEHIWQVASRQGSFRDWYSETLTTDQIASNGLRCGYKDKEYRYRIPMTEPVSFIEKDYIIDPYTMGALIANGSMLGSSAILTTPDEQVYDRISEFRDLTIMRPEGYCPRAVIVGAIGECKRLGLNVRSSDKFIPESYLQGSVDQRIALLQGLMDGDGGGTGKKAVRYFTSSKRLGDDVVRLVHSLGGTAMQRWIWRKGADEGAINIMLPDNISPFSTPRKSQGATINNHVPNRGIKSIERVENKEIRCITVAANNHLYLIGKELIVTHNTLTCCNIIHRMTHQFPEKKILLLSLEQTRGEWFERAHRINRFYNPWATVQDTLKAYRENFLIIDKNRVTSLELENSLDQYNDEMGQPPDLVIVDYLGYWARGFKGETYERTTAAIMNMKAIAKEYRIAFISPHQVSRQADLGAEISLNAARDGGTVEETADLIIGLWSPDQKVGTHATQRTGKVHAKVLKSRRGGNGTEVELQLAPATLALVPKGEKDYGRAFSEYKWVMAKDTLEQVVERHRSGRSEIDVALNRGVHD